MRGGRESMVLFGRESHGSLPPEKRPEMTIVAVRRFPRNLAFPNRIWIPPAPIFAVLVFLFLFFPPLFSWNSLSRSIPVVSTRYE